MIYVYMFVFVLKVWIWEQVAKVSSPRLTRPTWITVTLIPRRRRWRGKDTFLVIWDLWRHWRIKAPVSFVKQFEELSETRKNLPFHKAVSWKCPIRVFEWSIEVNHGYIQDLKVLLKFPSPLYLFFPFFFLTNGTLCFFRRIKDPVTIISTRLRMFHFARFILAIIATSASSRSILPCKGSLATFSSVKNLRGPLPKPSGMHFPVLSYYQFVFIIIRNFI